MGSIRLPKNTRCGSVPSCAWDNTKNYIADLAPRAKLQLHLYVDVPFRAVARLMRGGDDWKMGGIGKATITERMNAERAEEEGGGVRVGSGKSEEVY